MSSRQSTSQAIVISFLLLLVAGNECSADAISDLVGQVSQSQYTTHQLTIERMGLGEYGGADYNQGYRDRFIDEGGRATLGNQEAQLYLSDQLMSMGLDVSTQGLYQNVVGAKQEALTPDQIYIVCAHYDTYEGSVDDERPGGEDNASGTAGMLEAARVLSQYEFESTIRFIGFNAEEINLLGSYDYVDNVLVAAGENVVGVINLDVIFGTFSFPRPPTPADLDVITAPLSPDPDEPHCPGCSEWANTFIRAANTYVPTLPIDPRSPRGKEGAWPLWALGDQRSFLEQGYPAIWTLGGVTDYIHGPEDASDGLAGEFFDYAFATDVVSAVVATIAQEAKLILIGDFDENGVLDAEDINLLANEIPSQPPKLQFDLNGDELVDDQDLRIWVHDLKHTWFGDANLDLEFNSSDMVQVFQRGKYEKDEAAKWEEGDWDGSLRFDSSDMVTAFVDGGYEKPRTDAAAVPEPTGAALGLAAACLVFVGRRTRERITLLLLSLTVLIGTCTFTYADVYRWDTGEVIPGTEGLPSRWLPQMELEYADLSNRSLWWANYEASNLTRADLSFSNLIEANLTEANLTGANLTGTDFRMSRLKDANFAGAVVIGSCFGDTTSYGFTKEQLYSTASYQQKDLRGIELFRNDLSGWDLSGQDLSNANLGRMNNADLRGAQLKNARLYDLTSAIVDATTIYNQGTSFPSDFDPAAAGLTFVLSPPGDFNGDDVLDSTDVDLFVHRLLPPSFTNWLDAMFDLNADGVVNAQDHRFWVRDLSYTWFGDANLDGEFNSADFSQVFVSGRYEERAWVDDWYRVHNGATWSEGDWNGDGVFDSSDMVTAFVDGGYEKGPRPPAVAVPEPGGWLLLVIAAVSLPTRRHRRRGL